MSMSINLWNPEESQGLTDFDRERIQKAWDNASAGETRRVYANLWNAFVEWCLKKEVPSLPASPPIVAAYLTDRASTLSWSSVCTINAAIRKYHEDEGHKSPTLDLRLKKVRRGIRKDIAVKPRQVEALTRDAFALIAAAGWEPRSGESPGMALLRAVTDIALIALMRDCLLRRGEVARAQWQDLVSMPGGNGALTIPRSKTDRFGKSVQRFVSRYTMLYLYAMLDVQGGSGPKPGDHIFGFGDRQVANRIQRSAEQANLVGPYRGHSPRIGMAQDLAAGNAEMPSLMQAGRWSSGAMVYRYIERARVAKSTVAMYYEMVDAGVLDGYGPEGLLEVA